MKKQIFIQNRKPTSIKQCAKCNAHLAAEDFPPTNSFFYPDGYLPYCYSCIEDYLRENKYDWEIFDKLCQYADIPFIPNEYEKVRDTNPLNTFTVYSKIFSTSPYNSLEWADLFKEFRRLRAEGNLESQLPLLKDKRREELHLRWGYNYDDEALAYLENLYLGLQNTQNIAGAVQADQALKLCKISYEIDSRIREGSDFDKLLGSYDKLLKTAEFTPKNTKSAQDFDSVGELFYWLEKRGFKNEIYDGTSRDIVDETIQNIQNSNRQLYTNETGIGEEITRRIAALQSVKELESYYGTDQSYALDEYEQEGFDALYLNDKDFDPDL